MPVDSIRQSMLRGVFQEDVAHLSNGEHLREFWSGPLAEPFWVFRQPRQVQGGEGAGLVQTWATAAWSRRFSLPFLPKEQIRKL